jgi:hypothetical protein
MRKSAFKFDMTHATANFAKVVNELGRLQGFDREKIIRAEAGSILKKCMGETKVASLAKIEAGANLRTAKGLGLTGGGEVSINVGLRGPFGRVFARKLNGSGYRRTHDEGFAPLNYHYKDATWAKISTAIADYRSALVRVLAQAKLSAGLARQSWLLIAESLAINLLATPGGGISAGAIQQAAAARGHNGKIYPNGTGSESRDSGLYFMTLTNRLPYGRNLGFANMLSAAVAGRASYIQNAIAKGALSSYEKTVRAFKGWKVTGGIN